MSTSSPPSRSMMSDSSPRTTTTIGCSIPAPSKFDCEQSFANNPIVNPQNPLAPTAYVTERDTSWRDRWNRTKVKRLGLVILATGLLVGCGGGGDDEPGDSPSTAVTRKAQSPEDAVEDLLLMINREQWGPEWDVLHPAHQQLVPRDFWIQCAETIGYPNFTAKAVDSYEEQLAIPGTNFTGKSTAVTVEFTIDGEKSNDTFHVFDVDGSWRWVFSAEDITGLAKGECP